MTKKVFYWLMMIAILIALNTATICWMVYNFVPSSVLPDISMWDIGVLKGQLQLAPSQYLSAAEKGAIYVFMVVGAISSFCFIKWLFKDTLQQVREKAKEKKDKAFNKFNKDLD